MVAERYCLLPRLVLPQGGTRPPSFAKATDDRPDAFSAHKTNPSGGRVPPIEQLTPAEQSVLAYVCAGYSNKEIARFLGKAEPTVKHQPSPGLWLAGQVSACLRKFGVSSRYRLMAALR